MLKFQITTKDLEIESKCSAQLRRIKCNQSERRQKWENKERHRKQGRYGWGVAQGKVSLGSVRPWVQCSAPKRGGK
jgi:hypothetical protein